MDKYDKVFELCKSLGEGMLFPTTGIGDSYQPYTFLIQQAPVNYVSILNKMDTINELIQCLNDKDFYPIAYTPKGYIKKWEIGNLIGAYTITEDYRGRAHQFHGVELTVIINRYIFRFKIGSYKPKDSELTGPKAFRKLLTKCKKYGINLENYQCENGELINMEIDGNPRFFFDQYKKKEVIKHANHLDLVSAWPSQIAMEYPEFKPVFTELRKEDKLIGSIAIGMFHSAYLPKPYSPYSLANLAKIGINNTNEFIWDLCSKMRIAGCTILGVNTDGIWYTGPVYHSEYEGTELGCYKNDHIDVDLYIWGDAQYYYIENEQLKVVASGYYKYEMIKPRDQWDRDDFIRAMHSSNELQFNRKIGFMFK